MILPALALSRRDIPQDTGSDGDSGETAFFAWHYAIVGAIVVLLLLYFLIGFYHARRRIARGLPPLPYHRWMVRNIYPYPTQRYQYGQNAGEPGPGASNPNEYPLRRYPSPPPMYNSRDAPPPAYIQPEGASKIAADQNYRGASGSAGQSSGNAGATTRVAEVTDETRAASPEITAPAATAQQRQAYD